MPAFLSSLAQTWKGVRSGSRENFWYTSGFVLQAAGSCVSFHELSKVRERRRTFLIKPPAAGSHQKSIKIMQIQETFANLSR
jgi:type II secretory pathway component PulF